DGPEVLVGRLPSGTDYNSNNPGGHTYENFGMTRFDYTISNRDSFSANYTFDDGQRESTQADSYYSQFVTLRNQTLGLQETRVLSTNAVNFARLGWVRPDAA